jgi:hypothetical protein
MQSTPRPPQFDTLSDEERSVLLTDRLDGRAKLVQMTVGGWRVMDAAFAIVDELETEWAAQLGEERFQQLRDGLGELFDIVERSEADERIRASRLPRSVLSGTGH